MGAHKGHFRIICAVCVRLVQPGKEGSETIIGVCDDCRTQSQIEAKRHHDVFNHESPRTVKRAYRVDQSRRHVDYPDTYLQRLRCHRSGPGHARFLQWSCNSQTYTWGGISSLKAVRDESGLLRVLQAPVPEPRACSRLKRTPSRFALSIKRTCER